MARVVSQAAYRYSHMDVTAPRPPTTALASSSTAVIEPVPSLVQRVAALPMQRKLVLGGGIAALLAIALTAVLWSQQPDYKVLFTNLSDKDGGAIVAQLSQMNVPYKHAEGGNAILVPANQIHDVRLKLASMGLPKGSVAGYELMESQRFGVTQFQERLNFQRGLEGELIRSIESLSAVQSARVHLALPNQNGFFREQQKPSASVLLQLYPGRVLERAQIAGIVHLVSSSVPEMQIQAVSVVDQSGALLSAPANDGQDGGLDAQQLQYRNQVEANLTKRVISILEPVVGQDNLRAQVTAELDFAQVESTSEEFRPNQGQSAKEATVRSQQTTESSGPASATPTGVPGAATNQPPVPATAPVNGASQPLQAAQGSPAGSNSHREAVTNYEVDKTVRVTRNAIGSVKRLNAAVVVNHITRTDAKGKTTTLPLTDVELEKLTTLVRESIGFNAERGDSVKVINAPFKLDKLEPESAPFWQNPQLHEVLRMAAVPLTLLALAAIVVFGAIRPVIKAAQDAYAERMAQLNAVVDDEEELPEPPPEPPKPNYKLQSARMLAKDNPAAIASIVREWVAKDA